MNKKLLQSVREYKKQSIIAPLLVTLEVLMEVLIPLEMAKIIDIGIAGGNLGYIVQRGLILVIMAMMSLFFGVQAGNFAAIAGAGYAKNLRHDIYYKVQDFSFKNIDQYSTGSLVTRLTNDVQQVQNVTMMGLRLLFRAPGMLIGALIMALLMNAKLALVILIVIPFLSIAIVTIMVKAFPRFTLMQKKIDKLNSGIQEALTNVRVIKSFVREDYEEEKFQTMNQDLKDSSLNAMKIVIATMPIMMFAMNVTTLAVVWYGGNIIIAGNMQVGDLTAFTTYIVQILMSLMMLSMVLLQSSRAIASVKRISEVLDTEIDLTDENASRKDLKVTEGKVEFKDVAFSYSNEGGEKILEHINFTAEPGKVLGIIGTTGSGKTSLVQLIPRLYDVTEGQVLVDGVDVREYSLKNLRDGVGMVLQKNVLFSGTIDENLRWGNEEASEEEVRSAAGAAQADGFVTSFTKGYDSDLGQGGSNVSGGQKQRLCIARALLKKPKILILDDSTSAVDTATEAKIRESFSTTLKDTTKIIIAQRIGSVESADKIIVLDDGKIIGMGTHEELMKNCEAYQEIYYSQRDREKEVSAS